MLEHKGKKSLQESKSTTITSMRFGNIRPAILTNFKTNDQWPALRQMNTTGLEFLYYLIKEEFREWNSSSCHKILIQGSWNSFLLQKDIIPQNPGTLLYRDIIT